LIGLPGVKKWDFDPIRLAHLPPKQERVPRIILSHYPDRVEGLAPLQADAVLAGHTHGGQICLPGGRATLSHDTLPKYMARGVHRFGNTTLIVNRGFGATHWPIRIFCPAEVIEIVLSA
jgi:predicted MPP superfamily phosphohydrolase